MAAKLFINKSFQKKKEIIIKKNKFFIYKTRDNFNSKSSSINEKKITNKTKIFKIFNFSSSKKRKVLKNNKFVYENNFYTKEKYLHYNKTNAIKTYTKGYRSSIYRGVSKNGDNWQVLLMNNKRTYYLGNFQSEKIAARIYDIFSLKLRGNKAITNFSYGNEIKNKIKKIKFDNINQQAFNPNFNFDIFSILLFGN